MLAAPAADTPSIPDDSVLIKTRRGQHTVLSRLQGFFPGSASSPSTPAGNFTEGTGHNARSEKPLPFTPSSRKDTAPDTKALKIRMVTWNMHDSLPKGELEELFGKVPAYRSLSAPSTGKFPMLPMDADHPYHFVVVAGQECPSSSGLPMGLGATFKLIDKDKDKDKDKERPKENEKDPEFIRLRQREKEMDEIIKNKKPDDADNPPVGWTSIVEGYLCQGGGSGLRPVGRTAKVSDVSSTRPLINRSPSTEPKKGPYQLLVKERLMGIYLAIYIHRDLKPLVRGTSRSAVAAGLIGGRVGNKGGVGISINLDGTTLLFLNAHLAAHEGKVHHRLANMAKIKTELEVDDFLAKGDPRKSLEDLTDRFDFTFLCGDLNFRLDITRLHADWLISRQEYTQALAFDQLQNLMKEGAKEITGFSEAPINFAPTFKYDVLRTVKRSRRVDDEDADEDGEAMSVSSMSTYSRVTDLDIHNGFEPSPSTPTMATSTSKVSLSQVVTAQKDKVKLLALRSPLFSPSPMRPRAKRFDENGQRCPPTPARTVDYALGFFTPKTFEPSTSIGADGFNSSLPATPRIQVESAKSFAAGVSEEDVNMVEKGVYDSSHKKRVPSWCDRILWKSTIEPSPSPVPSRDIAYHPLLSPPRNRNKIGQFLAHFRPMSARSTRQNDFLAVPTTPDSSLSPSLPPLKTAPPLTQTMFPPTPSPLKNPSKEVLDDDDQPQPPWSAKSNQERSLRRAYSTTSPPPTAPAFADRPNRRSTAFGVLISPLSGGDSATPSRWRFLPNFLSPTHSVQHTEIPEDGLTSSTVPSINIHRRGDVVCLNYDTLDDRGMRRLEGKSDHRPVLGLFAAYF